MAQVFELAGIYKLGKGGMTSFANAILQDTTCEILVDTILSEITQSGSWTELKSKKGRTFEARAVISTIPLNCLSDVTFTPPLGMLRRKAASQGHIKKGAKIHYNLSQIEPSWYAICNGYGQSPFCFEFMDHNGTKASGPDGTYCIGFGYNGHLEVPQDHTTIIKQFQKYLRPGVDVQAYLTHDWMNDPLAKGTWSCWGPNSMSRYLQELQKPHGSVFFASADWANGWRGFVDGALKSGKAAATEVVNMLALTDRPRL